MLGEKILWTLTPGGAAEAEKWVPDEKVSVLPYIEIVTSKWAVSVQW